MLKGQTVDLVLEEEWWYRVLLGNLTRRGKETKTRANTNFQSIRIKLSPFLFCAYRTDIAYKCLTDRALMKGWPMQ